MLKTTVCQVERVLMVALADAKTHKVVEKITASREHPFYVRGKGFVPAGGLAVGNAIVMQAGPALVVQSIQWNQRAGGYTVYNFVVEDDHSYFVGTHYGGAWVHNPAGDCDVATLLTDHYGKLQSILGTRGETLGYSRAANPTEVRGLAADIANHAANAPEAWQAPYRGSDQTFIAALTCWVGRPFDPSSKQPTPGAICHRVRHSRRSALPQPDASVNSCCRQCPCHAKSPTAQGHSILAKLLIFPSEGRFGAKRHQPRNSFRGTGGMVLTENGMTLPTAVRSGCPSHRKSGMVA